MSNKQMLARDTFKEDLLGTTNKEEDAVHPEADPGKTTSETVMPCQNSDSEPEIKQAGYDIESSTSEPSEILRNEPQRKQAVPAFAEEVLTDPLRGIHVDLPLQEILALETMLIGPVTSLSVGFSSETGKSPVKSTHHLPVGVDSVLYDQFQNIGNELSPVTTVSPVQKAINLLHGSFDSEPQIKNAEPAVGDEESQSSFKEHQIAFSISQPAEMLSTHVTLLAAEHQSEINLSPLTSPQQPISDNAVQHDHLHKNCQDLPSDTCPLVQREGTLLNGISDTEPLMQPVPVVNDEQDHCSLEEYQNTSSSEEAISELEEMLSSPVKSPASEALSEVDESPDVDENDVPDSLSDKLSYQQSSHHQSPAVNYIHSSQLQRVLLKLPLVTGVPLIQHDVMGNSFSSSKLRYPCPELSAACKREYHQRFNFNLPNPHLPQIQHTSVPASSCAFVMPPGLFASAYTGCTSQHPTASWANGISTRLQPAADRMLFSANHYSNNGSMPPLTGKRPREDRRHLADQVPTNGYLNTTNTSGSDYQRFPTYPNQQVNVTRQGSLSDPATRIPLHFYRGQSVISPSQHHTNVHPPGRRYILAPSNVNTRAQRVSMPVSNSLYNPRYEQAGLPIDPIMRAFMKSNQRNNNQG